MAYPEATAFEGKYHILGLPAELRQEIWGLACSPFESDLKTHRNMYVPRCLKYGRKLPAITRTCCKIRDEALPLFFVTKVFVAPALEEEKTLTDFKRWLRGIERDVHHLGYLAFTCDSGDGYPLCIKIIVKRGQLVFSTALGRPDDPRKERKLREFGMMRVDWLLEIWNLVFKAAGQTSQNV